MDPFEAESGVKPPHSKSEHCLTGIMVRMYHHTHKGEFSTMVKAEPPSERILVERVQTGVRLEKRLLKVLKGLAEYHDMTLGDLLEGIVLHAFDGQAPFGPESRRKIEDLKKIYGLDLRAKDSHKLSERKKP